MGVNILHASLSSSDRTKCIWDPQNTSRIKRSYASGSFTFCKTKTWLAAKDAKETFLQHNGSRMSNPAQFPPCQRPFQVFSPWVWRTELHQVAHGLQTHCVSVCHRICRQERPWTGYELLLFFRSTLKIYNYKFCCFCLFCNISIPLPHLRINGTPSHLSLVICKTPSAYVGVTESGGTVLSSKYPNFSSPSPSGFPTYCPKTTSFNSKGFMHLRTFT